MKRRTALRAAQFGVRELAAVAMTQEDGRAGIACRPAVTPRRDRHQYVAELVPLVGQQVVVAHRPIRVRAAFEHTVFDEAVQSL